MTLLIFILLDKAEHILPLFIFFIFYVCSLIFIIFLASFHTLKAWVQSLPVTFLLYIRIGKHTCTHTLSDGILNNVQGFQILNTYTNLHARD